MRPAFFRRPGVCLASLFLLSLPATARSQSASDHDPGECQIERIPAEDDIRSFQLNSMSPDGETIAIGWDRESGERGTYLLDLTTGAQTDVPEMNNGAIFSPDGRRLLNAVYVDDGKTDIVEIDIESRDVTIIASHPEWDWLPCYSPDGSRIVFSSYRSGNSDIYVYDQASQELTQLTNTDMYEAHAQFSPDGTRIAFHRQVSETDFNIYILDLNSGSETQITDSPREESYPSWAADGKHLFFSSDTFGEIGKPDIMVMTDQGTIVSRLTHHPAKDAYAFASPDGEYVYFNSYREPQGVYRVKIDSSFKCK